MQRDSMTVIIVCIGVTVVVAVVATAFNPASAGQTFGFCGVICVSLFGLYQAQLAARRVEEVKVSAEKSQEATATKLDAGLRIAKDTHTLVNSNMGVQLTLNSELSRWKAVQTGEQVDIDAADLADKLLREHKAKQSVVDGTTTTTTTTSLANALIVADGAAEVATKAKVVAAQAAEVAKDVK